MREEERSELLQSGETMQASKLSPVYRADADQYVLERGNRQRIRTPSGRSLDVGRQYIESNPSNHSFNPSLDFLSNRFCFDGREIHSLPRTGWRASTTCHISGKYDVDRNNIYDNNSYEAILAHVVYMQMPLCLCKERIYIINCNKTSSLSSLTTDDCYVKSCRDYSAHF
jgi:hypothetical protein